VALIRGCHVIAKGDQSLAPGIARKIIQSGGLQINQGMWGTGVWAYYVDMVPSWRKLEPMVVFDVDEKYVTKKPNPLPYKRDFAYMKMSGSPFDYIPISILGFFNLPNFPVYPHPIGFV
jgi:hypothetical protein